MANFGMAMTANSTIIKPDNDSKALLNTCIHNYLLLEGHTDLAKAIRNSNLPTKADRLKKEGQLNQVNGIEASDGDKDDKRFGADASELGLLDYWFIFWDMWTASKSRDAKADSVPAQYLAMQQQMRQPVLPQQMMAGAMNNQFGRFMPGAQMNLQKNAMNNNAQRNMAQFSRMGMNQQPMQREGSDMDGNQQRPQSPMSTGENAPSPSKRQRTDGHFNGQQMMMGRGNPAQAMYSQGLASQTRSALTQFQNGFSAAQGASPLISQDGPSFDMAMMGNQMRGNMGGSNGGALADYQMQLMLLEQQNKKRLMMARQEQDVHQHVNMMGGQGYPQNTSPQGRNGQSPNGNDTKRNTPKLGQGSPPPEAAMGGARASPIPGAFDPNQMNMAQNFAPQMSKMMAEGMVPNMRPQPGHAPTAQQAELMQQQQKNGGRMPNGAWPGAPGQAQALPQAAAGQQGPSDGNQQPQLAQQMQQRGNMPPPQVPGGGAKAQASPSQANAAPPTPSQSNKAAPKAKKDTKDTKKKAPKKAAGTASATPNPDSERAPTPTPQTPATPIGHDSHLIKGQPQPGQPQPVAAGVVSQQVPGGATNGNNGMEPFGNIEAQNDFGVANFDFMDAGNMIEDSTADILGGFDFDTFLSEPNNWEHDFAMNGDGLESGAGP